MNSTLVLFCQRCGRPQKPGEAGGMPLVEQCPCGGLYFHTTHPNARRADWTPPITAADRDILKDAGIAWP